MKINWGTGIVIFIIMFVSGMAFLVYIAFNQKINLVNEDYYPLELEHQKMINKENNTSKLDQNISISFTGDSILLHFPALEDYSKVTGSVVFYRPSDFEKDITHDLQLANNGQQILSTSELMKGKYTMKVDWNYDNTAYFTKKDIHIK